MRGLAALAILVFHFKNFGGGGGALNRPASALDAVQALQWLSILRYYGSDAVMLFWAISGFVFMNVYAGRKPAAATFWLYRIARLYPLHLLTLLVVLVIQVVAMAALGHWLIFPANDVPHFVAQLFFASAWLPGSPNSFNGPIWSVSIEVLIYGVFFLYARYARTSLATTAIGFVVFVVATRLFPASQIPVCGTYFFGGMLSYAAFHLWPADQRQNLLTGSAVIMIAGISLGLSGRHVPTTAFVLPTIAATLIVAVISEETALRGLYRHTQTLGDITYSTYLWHSPIQMMFLLGAGLGYWQVDTAFSDAFFVAYLATVCVVGWLSFRYIERPAQKWVRALGTGRANDLPLIGAP